jgi:hypothetical protein
MLSRLVRKASLSQATDLVETARSGCDIIPRVRDKRQPPLFARGTISRHFLGALAVAAAVWFAVPLGFVWIIDPYGVSPVRVPITGLNVFKPKRLDIDRLIKPYEVWRYQPRTIFLGTSRIHQSIDPRVLDGTSYAPAYNAAIPAASIAENAAYLEQYLRTDRRLKYVFVELFIYTMISSTNDIPHNGITTLISNSLPLQFGMSAIADSVATLEYNETSQVRPPYVHQDGYWVRPDDWDISMHFIPQSYADFVLWAQKHAPNMQIYDSALSVMKHMQEICDQRHVKLTFIVTPNYPWDDYRLWSTGYWNFVRRFYHLIATLPNVYSFAQFTGPSEEPVSDRMVYWSDPFHFSRSMGSLIVSALTRSDAVELPPKFMVKIDRDTTDGALQIRYAGLQSWIKDHQRFVSTFEMAKRLSASDGRVEGSLDLEKQKLVIADKTYRVVPGLGAAEVATRNDGYFVVSGWAADLSARQPAAAITAAFGSRVVAEWIPTTGRYDVEEAFGRGTRPAGFVMKVPLDPGEPSDAAPLRLFALMKDGTAVQLASETDSVAGPPVALFSGTVEAGKLTIDGTTYPIVVHRLGGVLESAERIAAGYVVRGWAVDQRANLPVTAVIAFAGPSVVAKAVPMVNRPDVEQALASNVGRTGFVITVPFNQKQSFKTAPIRMFALMYDGVAAEISSGLSTDGAFANWPYPPPQ